MSARKRPHDEFDAMIEAMDTADKPHVHSVVLDLNTKTTTVNYLPLDFRPDDTAGEWVYFLRAAGFVKIGYTKDLAGRLKRLQTGSPHELKLLVLQRGSQQDEKRLHRQFGALRAHGEWFKLEGALLDYLSEQYRLQKVAAA